MMLVAEGAIHFSIMSTVIPFELPSLLGTPFSSASSFIRSATCSRESPEFLTAHLMASFNPSMGLRFSELKRSNCSAIVPAFFVIPLSDSASKVDIEGGGGRVKMLIKLSNVFNAS